MKVKYNAPLTLTFSLICLLILVLDQILPLPLAEAYFSVPGRGSFDFLNPLQYPRLVLHILGHGGADAKAAWIHLLGNMAFVLLLGPILEEKHGWGRLFIMMMVTALITGVLNVILFKNGLLGASGIVFMMILLVSFTNFNEGEVPLTFILILVLYLSKEIISIFEANHISEFAHIVGGLCGSLFGFLSLRRKKTEINL